MNLKTQKPEAWKLKWSSKITHLILHIIIGLYIYWIIYIIGLYYLLDIIIIGTYYYWTNKEEKYAQIWTGMITGQHN